MPLYPRLTLALAATLLCLLPLGYAAPKGSSKQQQAINALNQKISEHNTQKEALDAEITQLTRTLNQQRQALAEDIRNLNRSLAQALRLARNSTPLMQFQYPQQTAILRFNQQTLAARITTQQNALSRLITLQSRLKTQQQRAQIIGQNLNIEREKLLSTLQINQKTLAQNLTKANTKKTIQKSQQPTPKAATGAKITRPVTGRILTNYNATSSRGLHAKGVTIQASRQSPVFATTTGTILYAGDFRTYGGLIIIATDDDTQHIYGGLQSYSQKVNTQVKAGTRIATLPATPKPNLYYEVRRQNQTINPKPFLK